MRRLVSLPPAPSPTVLSSPSPTESNPWLYVPVIPIYDSPFDIAEMILIIGIFALSLLSICLTIHLRLKSRAAPHLNKFNNLWTARLVFVIFVFLWAVNELPRLPFLRHRYIFPFYPSLTIPQQTNVCKIHVVLSLGLFEPGFLIALLFLVNLSTNECYNKNFAQIRSILTMILPVFLFQTICVMLPPLKMQMPVIMSRTGMLVEDVFGTKEVICTYPLYNCIIFAAFAISYLLGFVLSCWRVMSFVINKGTKDRLNVLAVTVMAALPIQILFLGFAALATTEAALYGGSFLALFMSVAVFAVVGEVILVIKPISDALSAIGDSCVNPVQYSVSEPGSTSLLQRVKWSFCRIEKMF